MMSTWGHVKGEKCKCAYFVNVWRTVSFWIWDL
uniref:Uncharacterized protein n=1 Tax=Arundo donax TaxID=35708 RepID=A0A0A9BEN8_ARUDO